MSSSPGTVYTVPGASFLIEFVSVPTKGIAVRYGANGETEPVTVPPLTPVDRSMFPVYVPAAFTSSWHSFANSSVPEPHVEEADDTMNVSTQGRRASCTPAALIAPERLRELLPLTAVPGAV